MKIPLTKYLAFPLAIGLCFGASGGDIQNSKPPKAEPGADSPVGIWRGESVCTTEAPACHNEKVVYIIDAIPDKPDQMSIRADKIVDGKTITMGVGPWQYDRAKQTLVMGPEQRLWLLNIHGGRIDGTLTVSGNVVFRRMTLTRDR